LRLATFKTELAMRRFQIAHIAYGSFSTQFSGVCPVGPFRFAPRAAIPPDGDSDLVTHHPAREHGANREAIGELHFIGTTHQFNEGVWAAAARLVRDSRAQERIRRIAAALLRHGTLSGDEIGAL
jgi:hypothetical protein